MIRILFFGDQNYGEGVRQTLLADSRFLLVDSVEQKPDIGILASYGKILPQSVIASLPHGILNIHPSLLPKYRGPSPVQTAILNGDKTTGVTIIKLDEKIDHGPILVQQEEEIRPDDTAQTLYQRLFKKGTSSLLLDSILLYIGGKIKLREQDHEQATRTKMLTRDSGRIDWTKPPDYLERFVRAMAPWPGSWTTIIEVGSGKWEVGTRSEKRETRENVKRLKILKACVEKGKFSPEIVQLEGKKPVPWKQFLPT